MPELGLDWRGERGTDTTCVWWMLPCIGFSCFNELTYWFLVPSWVYKISGKY